MSAQGRTLVLIGHAGHPEVEGTMGQVGAPVHLVSSEAGCRRRSTCRPIRPVAYVTQTTLSRSTTPRNIIAALKRRFTDIVGPETSDICYATQNRQIGGARPLQGRGRHSGGRREEQLELQPAVRDRPGRRRSELSDRRWRASSIRLGSTARRPSDLTAGASAPEELVSEVIEALRRHGRHGGSLADGRQEGTYRVPSAGRTAETGPAARNSAARNRREARVGIPFQQAAKIGSYVVKQHLLGPQALSARADA